MNFFGKSFKNPLTNPATCCIMQFVPYGTKQNMRVWRNWQTRMIQVHIGAIRWRFKSSYPHQKEVSPSVVLLFLLLTITSIRLTEQQMRQETLADWVGKNKKAESPSMPVPQLSVDTVDDPASDNRVTQPDPVVNTQSMQGG